MKRSSFHIGALILGVAILVAAALVGCAGQTYLLPHPDPAMRKKPTQFAADAAKRMPYKADAPRGDLKEAPAAAQIHYSPKCQIDVVNLSSSEDYVNVELWLHQKYVVFVPLIKKNELMPVLFRMFYDADGNPFEIDPKSPRVATIEMLKDGNIYEIPIQIAD